MRPTPTISSVSHRNGGSVEATDMDQFARAELSCRDSKGLHAATASGRRQPADHSTIDFLCSRIPKSQKGAVNRPMNDTTNSKWKPFQLRPNSSADHRPFSSESSHTPPAIPANAAVSPASGRNNPRNDVLSLRGASRHASVYITTLTNPNNPHTTYAPICRPGLSGVASRGNTIAKLSTKCDTNSTFRSPTRSDNQPATTLNTTW